MRRIEKAVIMTVLSGLLMSTPVKAANNVRIETKSFDIDHPTCTVGVYVSNDVGAAGLVLALEFRTVSGGAYIGGTISPATFKWQKVAGRRVDNSPLGSAGANWPAASETYRKYSTLAGMCVDPRWDSSTSNTYTTPTANPDANSPDGFLLATVSQGDQGIGEDVELAAGSDPDGSPSYQFVFPANGLQGTFKIDSCCVAPANVNSFTDVTTAIFYMTTTPGTITLNGSAVKELETGIIPQDYSLDQNYPNPFNAGTVIRFAQPIDGNVKIDVFNILGRKVRTLVNEFRVAGTHQTDWDGLSDDGVQVATGVYFYRITTDAFSSTRKMVLLK